MTNENNLPTPTWASILIGIIILIFIGFISGLINFDSFFHKNLSPLELKERSQEIQNNLKKYPKDYNPDFNNDQRIENCGPGGTSC